MISVLCWKWGDRFSPAYVNNLARAIRRHLRAEHEVVCVTDSWEGIDEGIRVVCLPTLLSKTPRCIRRLRQYDRDFLLACVGDRVLSIDLDVVVTGDVTPLFDRPEPIVCWKVGYAKVYSGAVVLYDAGALHGLWERFSADPAGYAREAQAAIYRAAPAGAPWGGSSDQPVLNHYIRTARPPVAEIRDEDGVTTYFSGYRPHDPPMAELRPGVRLVVFGSANNPAIEGGAHPWIREHWQ